MEPFDLIVYLLPLVFMLHEFEEIICLKPWLKRNKTWIIEKHPRLGKPLAGISGLSSAALILIVTEEFILVSLATVAAIAYQTYYFWLAVFLAFSLHVVIHIVQWLIIRRYLPVIATSFLALAYGIYGAYIVSNLFPAGEILLCLFIGTVLMAVNLWAMHRIAAVFDRARK